MTLLLIAIAVLIAVVVTPIRAIVFVRRRAYWADRWRVAKRWHKAFAVAGWGLMTIAACESLALWAIILIKVADHRFLGGSGQAGLLFFVVVGGLGITMFVALVGVEVLMLPLRYGNRKDPLYGWPAETSAGSTTPAGPRST